MMWQVFAECVNRLISLVGIPETEQSQKNKKKNTVDGAHLSHRCLRYRGAVRWLFVSALSESDVLHTLFGGALDLAVDEVAEQLDSQQIQPKTW